jgi:hypothetical protein
MVAASSRRPHRPATVVKRFNAGRRQGATAIESKDEL